MSPQQFGLFWIWEKLEKGQNLIMFDPDPIVVNKILGLQQRKFLDQCLDPWAVNHYSESSEFENIGLVKGSEDAEQGSVSASFGGERIVSCNI